MLYGSVHSSVRLLTNRRSVSEIAHNSFDQIMHHSARNDQFAFHTCLMAPETDLSSFTTGCAHYRQLIHNNRIYFPLSRKMFKGYNTS